MSADGVADSFADWRTNEQAAEAMIPIVGRLYRQRDVMVRIFGRSLVRESAVGILRAHRFARQLTGEELPAPIVLSLLEALEQLELDSCRVDIGKLTVEWLDQHDGLDIEAFLRQQLASVLTGSGAILDEPHDVVLYGFGRIGRLVARILIARAGSGGKLRLRAIVLRPGQPGDLEKRASLLRRDSVHGAFDGTIEVEPATGQMIINGNRVQIIYAEGPDQVDYTAYGIHNAIVVDNTGIWRDEESLGRHLESPGAARVLLTAPGKGTLKDVIYGVNHEAIESTDTLVSAASCTTNAIVPALKVINDTFGIEHGHLETVHAYTNDQNLIDNFHSKPRRGRGAPLNMVITSTGAATAAIKALPELKGRLTGNAIRVPTPNVSLAILNLELRDEVTADEINAFLRAVSLDSDLRDQIDFTSSNEVVSSDIVGSDRTGVIDSQATIADGKRCVLYVWYDNENGYSYQVVRLVQELAGLNYPSVP